MFRFSPDEKENEEIWTKLKPLFWYAEGYQPKRGAEVLALHPKARAVGAARGGEGEAGLHPLIVQQFVGKGRVLFLGINETWRWGFREDQLHFNQFWIQAIRFLSRSRLGRIEVRLDRQTPYKRGEPIKVTVRFPDDERPPRDDTRVELKVRRTGRGQGGNAGESDEWTVQLARVEDSRATYEAVLTQTREGYYSFWLSQPVRPDPKPGTECWVDEPPGEMFGPRLNQEDLESAAANSDGRFYNLADALKLPADLPAGNRVTLKSPGEPWKVWNHTLLFLTALLLLTAEWLLRKRKNLL
jgi:hypothetical protein